jgi:uncharacterized coiled-coil protein SlyX
MMEEYQEQNQNGKQLQPGPGRINHGLLVAAVLLLIVAGLAVAYDYQQQLRVTHLTAQESAANLTIGQMRGQLNTLTAKLDEMTAAEEAKRTMRNAPPSAHPAATPKAPVDRRYKQLQSQLAEQQKQLKETQELVAKNHAELEGNLNTTRYELNGSIARTHEELVALEKRGERNYFEFDLTKSKQFQRVGPVTLSLRKSDTKHKNYNLELIVDDNELTKKNVNLYEPIWIHVENESQPVQVVVNRIEKNLVHGYVSAPRYKPAELAAAALPTAAQNPQNPK